MRRGGDVLTKSITRRSEFDGFHDGPGPAGAYKTAEMAQTWWIEFKAKVIIRESESWSIINTRWDAHLAIGLFVYFRRARAEGDAHVLCLASFGCRAFTTREAEHFDKVIY